MKRLSYLGLAVALICIATMLIQVPIPATKGFLNLGDSLVMILAVIFGPKFGFWAGAVGSSLADILSGYAHWAPWTFIIKGLEGLVVGASASKSFGKGNVGRFRTTFGVILGSVVMAFGYLFAGAIMYGWAVSWVDMTANIVQGIGSAAISLPVLYALRRLPFLSKNSEKNI